MGSVNPFLLISFVLSLGNAPVILTSFLNAYSQLNITVSAETDAVSEIPFTIDTDEIRGGAYISGGSLGFNWFKLNGQMSGVIRLEGPDERRFTKMSLLAADGAVIAEDLLIPGVKTTLTFDATTTARTGVITASRVYGATDEQQVALYQQAIDHPLFGELVEIFRDQKGWPTETTAAAREGEIEVRIAFAFIKRVRGEQRDLEPSSAQ